MIDRYWNGWHVLHRVAVGSCCASPLWQVVHDARSARAAVSWVP
jgi:hypothetical protein